MKWVKFKKEMDTKLSPKDKNLFQPINANRPSRPPGVKSPFNANLEAMLKAKNFEEWISYPQLKTNLSKRAMRKYEIFCGGFLYYHDEVFKKYSQGEGYQYPDPFVSGVPANWKKYPDANFQHTIFFEWLPKGTGVRVYINETPKGFNPKPPPPPAPPPPESNP